MKILYVSTVCTPKALDFIFNTSKIKPGQAVQKFHRLLVEGLVKNSSFCQVEVLSSLPVSPAGHKKIFWNLPDELWSGVRFRYVPFVNLPIIKHFFVFCITFFKVSLWCFLNRNNQKIVVCDILNVSIVWSAFIACKLFKQPMAVIVTDLPVFLAEMPSKQSIVKKKYLKITTFILHRFDYYIGLTEQMNEVVNPFGKPFLVMEGLVDSEIMNKEKSVIVKKNKRVLLYAGGIYEKYGVKNLIEAFVGLKANDVELHIYGSGDLEKEMHNYCKLDNRILYFGVVSNSIVVDRLDEATILINPRPTTEEFTKFSFPSKNMEYMVSGTPLLTTKLPGMPSEYNDYVYLFEDESVKGMRSTLEQLLSKQDEQLKFFGNKAHLFVLYHKSNVIQAKKIIDFLLKDK
jgi:glycosyltransferase involved in cell wall biosynthesis